MPASSVHAVLVARPDARDLGLAHFRETLAAIAAQTLPVDALTIVLCGSDKRFADAANGSAAEGIVQADSRTSYAEAVRLAAGRVAPDAALWLLAQDTVPQPEALAELAGRLELSPGVAVVAPKLVRRDDRDLLVSLGQSMTKGGAAVDLGRGQYDQGQHDRREDVLGADVRGLLLRAGKREALLPDVALGGADEGLDVGVRARLATDRVITAPRARIMVSADGVAGLPEPTGSAERRRIAYATRLAQLHRRLTYARAVLVPLHILSFIPIAIWRVLVNLVDKLPGRILPELAATVVAASRWGAIARSRARLQGTRSEWWRVDALRVSRGDLRSLRSDDADMQRTVRPDLRFFSGGGAWAVLASMLASAAVFPMLLGWPVLGGGGALPLRASLAQLWADTAFGLRGEGLGGAAPADPFAAVVAVLGSLWPAVPSQALVLLWVAALPLATLGGWFAATRFTERGGVRLVGAVLWTLSPWFFGALIDPRPAAVIAHLALPWLVYTALAAHRSWGAAGAASLLLLVVAACSPSLGALLVATVAVGVLLALVWRRFSGSLRFVWMLVPTAVFFAPLVLQRVSTGRLFALLADPGLPYQGARAGDDVLGRLATAAGFPDGTLGGWPAFLSAVGLDGTARFAPFVMVLVAPVAVLAVVSMFTGRWRVGTGLVGFAAVALVGSVVVTHIAEATRHGAAVAVWPGPWLSAGWLALGAAALVTLDELRGRRVLAGSLAAVTAVLFAATAVPGLTAVVRGTDGIANGPRSTLPAYVAADFSGSDQRATLVLTMLDDGSVAQHVVWGESDTLGAQSTVLWTSRTMSGDDAQLATSIADLITPDATAGDELAKAGIRFVLVEPVTQSSGAPAALRAQAVSALNQRAGLVGVGETGKGALWRVDQDVASRAPLGDGDATLARVIGIASLLAVAVAVMLAIPTRQSVRNARARLRVIGDRREQP